DRAVLKIASEHGLPPASVRRVAIIGPGLDFTDKTEGYDFYPTQSIQPFAVIDSLVRHGLAGLGDLEVTTCDVSARVNRHLDAARERARGGSPYVLQLPLDGGRDWTPDLVDYWQRLGDRIGSAVEPIAVPPAAGRVRIRAIDVRPDVAGTIAPRDV